MTEHILQLLNLSIVQMWKHLTGNLSNQLIFHNGTPHLQLCTTILHQLFLAKVLLHQGFFENFQLFESLLYCQF